MDGGEGRENGVYAQKGREWAETKCLDLSICWAVSRVKRDGGRVALKKGDSVTECELGLGMCTYVHRAMARGAVDDPITCTVVEGRVALNGQMQNTEGQH